MIKYIGQHIFDFIARFRNDVYFENLQGSSETTALVVDSDGKVTTNSLSGGSGDSEASKVRLPVRFKEAVVKGDPVYISGYNSGQDRAEVQKADCDDANKMPSFGLADAAYSVNDNGFVISIGNLEDVDTSSYSVGDTLYVASGGGLTNTKPATEAKLIQNVGVVTRSQQNNGQIEVVATGRSNDVPNLDSGDIFYGDTGNQTTTTSLNSVLGWHGSTTRIKILPSDFVPDNVGRPVMINDDSIGSNSVHLISHASASCFAFVNIPTGYKATHAMIHGSDTSQDYKVYEANINSSTVTAKSSATSIGTEADITDVASSTTNYLLIEVLSDGGDDELYGGYVTITSV